MKILLADDSMTAQNMGKKILVDAGYEVVAVSNGAQAVKKIASEKPDVVVLDVYMPGYTGLEVCERVKGAAETSRIPVLLTVGKMEPYKPEDGNRVKADGVIVKPFEASDLLAAVQKLFEKIAVAVAAPASPQRTTAISPPDFVKDSSYEEWKVSAPEHYEEQPMTGSALPAKIEVPNDVAATPAFGDLYGEETPAPPAPPPHDTVPLERSSEVVEPPAEAAASATTFDQHFAPPAPAEAPPPEPPLSFAQPEPPAPAPAHEFEATSAPKAHEVEAGFAPGFEPTISQDEHQVSDARDPELVTDATELAKFTTKFGLEKDEEIPVGIYTPPPEQAAEAAPAEAVPEAAAEAPVPPPPLADEFEARVAAAMESYQAPAEPLAEAAAPAPEPPPPPAPEPPAVSGWSAHETHIGTLEQGLSLHDEMQQAFAAAIPAEPEAAPPPEPPAPAPEPAPVAEQAADSLAAELAAAIAAKEPEPHAGHAVAEAPIPDDLFRQGSVVLEPGALASIIHRVVERLKPELASEIEKEIIEETKRKK